jgi:hypothetical protein
MSGLCICHPRKMTLCISDQGDTTFCSSDLGSMILSIGDLSDATVVNRDPGKTIPSAIVTWGT